MSTLAEFATPPIEAAATDYAWGLRGGNTAYDSAGFGKQETANWVPDRGSADAQILRTWPTTLARVRDLCRNDATAGAALQKLVDLFVGHSLRLSAHPDADALGITPDAAHALGRQIQSEWRLFADEPRRLCDAQRRMSMNGLFRLAVRTWLIAGESTSLITWRDDGGRYSTCVLGIDPDRLSNPYSKIDTMALRGGVAMDAFGAPTGYFVRDAHPYDWWAFGQAFTWTFVPRETEWGRPVFVHAFEPEREGQTRASSPFASIVGRLRMLEKFTEAEIASATLNALLAAFVETDLPPQEIAERMTAGPSIAGGQSGYVNQLAEYFKRNPASLGGVRMPVMPPGSKVTMNSTPRQTAAFDKFERVFVNRVASRLGIPGEMLTDYSQVNYSSMRAALNEMWRSVLRGRGAFIEQHVTPVYRAFLEEAFDKGFIVAPKGAPSFEEMPGAYLRARWIGPGRGYVDPVKEAEAATLRIETMISTLEAEAAEQGHDYEEILDQVQREEEALKSRGLTRLSLVAAVQSVKGPKPDSEEATGAAGVGGQDQEGSR